METPPCICILALLYLCDRDMSAGTLRYLLSSQSAPPKPCRHVHEPLDVSHVPLFAHVTLAHRSSSTASKGYCDNHRRQPSPNHYPTIAQPSPKHHSTIIQPLLNITQPSPTFTQASCNHRATITPPYITPPAPNHHSTITQASINWSRYT
jgi:hypothetical protein